MFRNCALNNNIIIRKNSLRTSKSRHLVIGAPACIVTWPELKAKINCLYAWSSSGLG